MTQYNVTGMSCAACSASVEKAVSGVEGVTSCSVSLLTNSMGVEGSASPAAIIAAVENAGYGAALKDGSSAKSANTDEDALADKETPKLLKRLIASVILLIPLMYVSMGHMMWGWPLPSFFEDNHVAMGLFQLLFAALIMVINQRFFISGFKAVIHRAPNMDTLVALGSSVSFLWSVYVLFMMTRAAVDGNSEAVMAYMMDLYFESAAMILALITVGKTLEAYSKGKTTDALKGLMKLAPKTAVILIDGVETTVSIDQVKKGDVFIVRPGDSVPVDGVVIEGESSVNESALTGESIPVDKATGDSVSAATINQSGYLKCEATRVGEDTTLSQIIKMVSDAAATKAPIAKIADKVSGIFVPIVIAIALITSAVWLIIGAPAADALARGIAVLVISCPCALGLATPVAIMVGNGLGARNGILFKTAVSLEETGKTQIIALDKTGTITKGEPVVTDIIPSDGVTDIELLTYAASLEAKSEHPLAKAVTNEAQNRNINTEESENFISHAGNGVSAVIRGETVIGGSLKYISQTANLSEDFKNQATSLADEGKTPLLFVKGGKPLGMIAVADVIKEDSHEAIKELQNMGIRVVMLTGDNERTAGAIGKQAGAHEIIAGVLPDGKEKVISELKKQGKVAMVGDGINDAPALTSADIGIAIGAGTDVAIDAADIVLVNSRLSDVPAAVRLSRATLTNIHENLFWAFIYNIIGIPLAAGVFTPIFGWTLSPMFGAAAMSLSSVCVVSNALRLNLFKIRDSRRDRRIKQKTTTSTEGAAGKITVNIKGMMCEHCEKRVKGALEAIPGVISAEASHEKAAALIETSGDVKTSDIKKAVTGAGYVFVSVNKG